MQVTRVHLEIAEDLTPTSVISVDSELTVLQLSALDISVLPHAIDANAPHRVSSGALADTSPKAMKAWVEALRELSEQDRMRLVFEMIEVNHRAAVKQIRREFPGYNETDVLREVCARRYGRDLAEKTYPRAMAAGNAAD